MCICRVAIVNQKLYPTQIERISHFFKLLKDFIAITDKINHNAQPIPQHMKKNVNSGGIGEAL